ncbi:MAG: glucose-6-phosphate isomerase [Candidatus Auribacterota bacterium]|nr:glucose-6-phosphate isomerase [Candidatus Auribacterota bacterium]
MSEQIRFDYNNALDVIVGPEHGIAEGDIEKIKDKISKAVLSVGTIRKEGNPGFVTLPYTTDAADEIRKFADSIADKYENFVVLGIGGSALGNIALNTALKHPFNGYLPKEKRKRPRIFVMDNVDPEVFNSLFDVIDLKNTLFNVITKSGGTAETMSQFIIVRDMLKKVYGKSYAEHVVATTDPEKGNLKAIAKEEGYKTFDIPQNVGGRFSVFSPVGLLSAAVTGIDIRKLLEGAKAVEERCKEEDFKNNPAYMYSILHYVLDVNKGKNISVMMPYASRLKDIADWYRQLWAESLGKKKGAGFVGQTPVKALGATDQHSQVQLYAEGPNDKLIIFLGVKNFDSDVTIPKAFEDKKGVSYLCGHTMSELFHAEQKATALALTKAKRPNATIWIDKVNENSIGQLLYMLELATAFSGFLYEIDPFNQPGVEEGKNLTYGMMGRQGYEKKKEEVEQTGKPDPKYVI